MGVLLRPGRVRKGDSCPQTPLRPRIRRRGAYELSNSGKMDLMELVRKADEHDADLDFLREAVRTLAQALMEADVSARIGAVRGQRSPDTRVTRRNGYRTRRWDTRVGTVDLAIPKLRQGSYFPDWLLEPRRRAERAIASVVMQAYVEGVSTRRVDDLARRWASRESRSRRCRPSARSSTRWSRRGGPGLWARARIYSCGSTRWSSRCARAGG